MIKQVYYTLYSLGFLSFVVGVLKLLNILDVSWMFVLMPIGAPIILIVSVLSIFLIFIVGLGAFYLIRTVIDFIGVSIKK